MTNQPSVLCDTQYDTAPARSNICSASLQILNGFVEKTSSRVNSDRYMDIYLHIHVLNDCIPVLLIYVVF